MGSLVFHQSWLLSRVSSENFLNKCCSKVSFLMPHLKILPVSDPCIWQPLRLLNMYDAEFCNNKQISTFFFFLFSVQTWSPRAVLWLPKGALWLNGILVQPSNNLCNSTLVTWLSSLSLCWDVAKAGMKTGRKETPSKAWVTSFSAGRLVVICTNLLKSSGRVFRQNSSVCVSVWKQDFT